MKTLILAIDIQNEYINKGGAFNIERIKNSLDNAKLIINTARERGIPLWHIKHEQEKKVFVKGTLLSNFIDGFEPIKNELCFTKEMYSCFSSLSFAKALAEEKPEEIVIIGYGTSLCCLCTIIEGVHRGYTFTLVEDATASRAQAHGSEEQMHQSAVSILRQYSTITNTDRLVEEFQSSKQFRFT